MLSSAASSVRADLENFGIFLNRFASRLLVAGERVEDGAVFTSRGAGGSGGGGGVGKAGEGERGPVSSSSVEMVELQSEATVRLEAGRPKSNHNYKHY